MNLQQNCHLRSLFYTAIFLVWPLYEVYLLCNSLDLMFMLPLLFIRPPALCDHFLVKYLLALRVAKSTLTTTNSGLGTNRFTLSRHQAKSERERDCFIGFIVFLVYLPHQAKVKAMSSDISLFCWVLIGGSRGRAGRMPPYGTQFFHFCTHFCQKVPVSEVHAPPYGKS